MHCCDLSTGNSVLFVLKQIFFCLLVKEGETSKVESASMEQKCLNIKKKLSKIENRVTQVKSSTATTLSGFYLLALLNQDCINVWVCVETLICLLFPAQLMEDNKNISGGCDCSMLLAKCPVRGRNRILSHHVMSCVNNILQQTLHKIIKSRI